ncbi:hypothetical protein ACF0H5_020829 [Mactra antiquata]
MYGDYTPGPDRRRYRDTRVSPSPIGQYPTRQTRYEDSRQTRYDDRRRYVTPSPEPLPLPHGSDVEDKPPTYVHGSRHHGYPKHVFTGRRDYGDKNYYFTDKDNNLVNPDEGKLREYRVVKNKPERSDRNGDFYINSDIEDDEDDIYDRTKVKGVKGHRVHVKIEHWKGMIGQKKYNDLKVIVEELYEEGQVTMEEKIGWLAEELNIASLELRLFEISRNMATICEERLSMERPVDDKMSPSKANSEVADEPDEDAHSKVGSETDMDCLSSRDSESPLTVTSVAVDDMITETVIKEEGELEKEAEEAEEKERKKHKELWTNFGEETKEERYKRLQFLLKKSNMYTEYLLKRMERQKEEDKKRLERIQKKKAKKEKEEADSKLKENSQPLEVLTQSSQQGQDSSAENINNANNRVENDTENNSSQNSVSSTGSLRRTRSRKSFPAPKPKTRLSATNTPVGSPIITKSETPKPCEKGDNQPDTTVKSDQPCSPSSEKENIAESEDEKVNKQEIKKSPKGAKLITNFFKADTKKRKHEEDADEETPAKKPRTKVSTQLFTGDPDIDTDGTIIRPALLTGGVLRKYQVEGLNWLKVLYENGVNGMLADEMGLGKTVQCVALMCQIVTMGAVGPFMVVAPLSTLPNWKMEFKRFAPNLPVVFYHGSKEERLQLQRQIRKKHNIMENVTIRPIVITSYEIAMVDRPFLQQFDWTYMIVDEGHRIKNKNCRLVRELKHYKNTHRLLLTGTPLQNNLSELWSLLNFLLPEIFDDLGSFEMWFDVEMLSEEGVDEAIIEEERRKNILGMLHQILMPFMLRRVKTDVELEIPPKKELLVYAPLSEDQRQFYQSTLDKTIFKKFNPVKEEPQIERNAFGRPKRGGKIIKKPEIFEESNAEVTLTVRNTMMQLRKVCNHPYLIEYPLDVFGNYKVDEEIVSKCGKMMVLDKMLPELRKRGHKILIFSQMTKMLDILEDYFYYKKIPCCRLDGSCKIEDRQESIEKFNTDPDTWIFLLSTRAGGLGINLVAADTVIIYDSDWNPQCDLQAQDRCHRIGQTKPVVVYRFVTAHTIDEKIVERAASKRKLEKMVIHKGKFKSGINREFTSEVKPLNSEELLELLKSTDHSGTVHQDKDEAISKKDLDLLLDRNDLLLEFEEMKKDWIQKNR